MRYYIAIFYNNLLFSDIVYVVSLSGGSCSGGLFRIAEDQVADAFVVAFNAKLFEDGLAFFALKLFLGAVDPAACNTKVGSCGASSGWSMFLPCWFPPRFLIFLIVYR